jgi:protease I
MAPFQALTALGHVVHAVCPSKKAGQKIKSAIHDFGGNQTYAEGSNSNFVLNASFTEVKSEYCDALMIAGGRAPEYLRLDQRAIEIVRSFAEEDSQLPLICHAAQILAAAELIRGATGVPACAPEARLAGGEYAETAPRRGEFSRRTVRCCPTGGSSCSPHCWPRCRSDCPVGERGRSTPLKRR